MRGYFAIGIYHPKKSVNCGTLWRSANAMGASAIFTISPRFNENFTDQCTDTMKSWRHMPYLRFKNTQDLRESWPYADFIGVEMHESATPVKDFIHPERGVYILGAEDSGLPDKVLDLCRYKVYIPSSRCLNVAVAGSIILYDRTTKTN